VKTCPLEYFCQ